MLRIRTPRYDEAPMLTDLCLRSKAFWGYDEEFMRECRGELTLMASIMQSSSCFQVAEIDGQVIGVAQVLSRDSLPNWTKFLSSPTHLRSGAGRALLWAATVARDAGQVSMVVEADPNAAGFYRRMGAVDDGTAPSGSILGRFLPRLLHPFASAALLP
jgi:hypothetical protein